MQSETSNHLFVVTWDRLIGQNSNISNKLFYKNFDESSVQGEAYPDLSPVGAQPSDIQTRPEILYSQRTETEAGWRLDFATENHLGEFSSGLRATLVDLNLGLNLKEDWIRFTYDSEDTRPTPDTFYVVLTPENTNTLFQRSEAVFSAYSNQTFITGDWEFRGGLRYDYDGFSDETRLSPRLGATVFIGNALRIVTTLGRYYQAPSFSERASDSANNALNSEIIDQASIGLLWNLDDKINFFVEPYYQSLKDVIVEEDGTARTLSNNGSGRSYGFDSALTRQFDKGWSANITYSFNQAQIRNSENEEYYNAEYSRPHAVTLGGVWEINDRWKLSSRWKWASGKPSDTYIFHENVLGDGEPLRYSRETVASNTGRYASYSSLNFRADYQRSFGRTNIIAFLDVINLTASTNPSNEDFNERSGENIEEEGNVFPIIGFRLEW